MPVLVRPIGMQDVAGFHECVDFVARERRFLASTEAPPLERSKDFVVHNLANHNAHYVAVADGRVVGWCDAVPITRPPACAHRATLGMGVSARFRGQGIGERLIRATVEHAWGAGLLRIDLDVRTDNEPAIRLYEKIGFRREGVRRCGLFVDGEPVDLLCMGLLHPSLV